MDLRGGNGDIGVRPPTPRLRPAIQGGTEAGGTSNPYVGWARFMLDANVSPGIKASQLQGRLSDPLIRFLVDINIDQNIRATQFNQYLAPQLCEQLIGVIDDIMTNQLAAPEEQPVAAPEEEVEAPEEEFVDARDDEAALGDVSGTIDEGMIGEDEIEQVEELDEIGEVVDAVYDLEILLAQYANNEITLGEITDQYEILAIAGYLNSKSDAGYGAKMALNELFSDGILGIEIDTQFADIDASLRTTAISIKNVTRDLGIELGRSLIENLYSFRQVNVRFEQDRSAYEDVSRAFDEEALENLERLREQVTAKNWAEAAQRSHAFGKRAEDFGEPLKDFAGNLLKVQEQIDKLAFAFGVFQENSLYDGDDLDAIPEPKRELDKKFQELLLDHKMITLGAIVDNLGKSVVDQGQNLIVEFQEILEYVKTKAINRISAALEDQKEKIRLLREMVKEEMSLLRSREDALRDSGDLEGAKAIADKVSLYYDKTLPQIKALEERYLGLVKDLRKAGKEVRTRINNLVKAFQGETIETEDAELDDLIARDPKLARLYALKPLVVGVITKIRKGEFSFKELGRVFNFNFGLEKPIPHLIEPLILWLSRVDWLRDTAYGEDLARLLREARNRDEIRLLKAQIATGIEDKLREIAENDPDPDRKQKAQKALEDFNVGINEREDSSSEPTVKRQVDAAEINLMSQLSKILENEEPNGFAELRELLEKADANHMHVFLGPELEAWLRDKMGFLKIVAELVLLRPIDYETTTGEELRKKIIGAIESNLLAYRDHKDDGIKRRAGRALLHFKSILDT